MESTSTLPATTSLMTTLSQTTRKESGLDGPATAMPLLPTASQATHMMEYGSAHQATTYLPATTFQTTGLELTSACLPTIT